MGGMAGGGLVVSSGGANKPLSNSGGGNMFAPGGHPGVPQGMPNGPMMGRVGMQMGRGASLHMGPRLQGPALCGPQGMPGNTPYYNQNPNNRPQGVQVGKCRFFFLRFFGRC